MFLQGNNLNYFNSYAYFESVEIIRFEIRKSIKII